MTVCHSMKRDIMIDASLQPAYKSIGDGVAIMHYRSHLSGVLWRCGSVAQGSAAEPARSPLNPPLLSIGKWQIFTPQKPKPLNGFWWNLAWLTTSGTPPHMTTLVGLAQRGWSGQICALSHLRVSFLFFLSLVGKIIIGIGLQARANRGCNYISVSDS